MLLNVIELAVEDCTVEVGQAVPPVLITPVKGPVTLDVVKVTTPSQSPKQVVILRYDRVKFCALTTILKSIKRLRK